MHIVSNLWLIYVLISFTSYIILSCCVSRGMCVKCVPEFVWWEIHRTACVYTLLRGGRYLLVHCIHKKRRQRNQLSHCSRLRTLDAHCDRPDYSSWVTWHPATRVFHIHHTNRDTNSMRVTLLLLFSCFNFIFLASRWSANGPWHLRQSIYRRASGMLPCPIFGIYCPVSFCFPLHAPTFSYEM